ncbi:phosphoglycerate mutase (2,3-diphosphoglycerate-independent) [Candidatus Curtissbacteria bacterium RBG_13_40_7]|uniref:2,3-bisphosphoglycerate-independent phosphoglycerate mutase n=1 Tax=Candidatus Curtissbacteria bacterium RBG_13_40_7 TaxID=1797706 RepID=A0A1F5FXJ4_9BACT|nr:MAG: phosphoglycerate mutase (2,3-diphosphoglycerate-independent) [Candidatus Curtissbacteria bacterium RBG_13_40_7]
MLKINQKPKPLVLCILDGWGIAKDSSANAITQANCTNFNHLWFAYPHALLTTVGHSVGLPEGEVGNSEVGHQNLGAGRIVFQEMLRINMSIADGTFFENEAFISACDHVKKFNSKIHLMGLVGLGAVHSEMEHLYALLNLIQKQQIQPSKVKIHIFTDGRDSPPTSAKIYVEALEKKIKEANLGQIASVGGRYFAMDRDNRWERTGKEYNCLLGKSTNYASSALEGIDKSYMNGRTDEFIEPFLIVDSSQIPIGKVAAGDAIIFFNHRADRARQLTQSFVLDDMHSIKSSDEKKIETFDRGPKLTNLYFVTLAQYEKNLPVNKVAYLPEEIIMPIARIFSERNARQLHIAETEKYAHVTYFFNGGHEKPFTGEDRVLVPSPKVASYDLAPEMSAAQITKELIKRINLRLYDFIVVNYANPDMVAHTGNIEATIKALQTVDNNLGLLAKAIFTVGGGLIVTSDHGNAEQMINFQTGEIDTEHNLNPAPCILAFNDLRGLNVQLPQGLLADVAPTILAALRIPKPPQMTGRSLL